MIYGTCKYCGEEKELINSHVIPKSLCCLKETGNLISIDAKKKKFDKNPIHQNGIKEYLMCKNCDNLIGILDNYASKIFKNVIPNHSRIKQNNISVCQLTQPDVDYWKFKKFFISLLWRASLTKEGINLGKYQEIALKMIKDELPDNPNLFLTLIYEMNTKTGLDLSSGVFGNKSRGKHIYVIHIPHYLILIIPNTEYSSNPKEMKWFKTYFNKDKILIHKLDQILPFEKQLIDLVITCKKNTS